MTVTVAQDVDDATRPHGTGGEVYSASVADVVSATVTRSDVSSRSIQLSNASSMWSSVSSSSNRAGAVGSRRLKRKAKKVSVFPSILSSCICNVM